MPYYEIFWNDEPGGNREHIAEHDLTPDDIDEVVFDPMDRDVSRSSGLPIVCLASRRMGGTSWSFTSSWTSETTIYPVTAYDVEE